jgi:hypothetical protein
MLGIILFSQRVPFSEEVLALIFRAYGRVTEISMKQMCTDEVSKDFSDGNSLLFSVV